jgi:hypothetical protein
MDLDPRPEPTPEPSRAAPSWQASVTVWATPGGAWSARVVLADRSEHAFHTPFELARFFARPSSTAPTPEATRGLR